MEIPNIIPLKANRVWRTYLGGKFLDEFEGKEDPKDSYFSEDWIISATQAINKGREDHEGEGLSKIELQGEEYALKDILQSHYEDLIGEYHYTKYGPNPQFILKFLDAAIRLHIQCHPTQDFAKKYLNIPSGKTEAYYILKVRQEIKEPYIYLGFQHPPTPSELKDVIEAQNIEKLLTCFEKISVSPGDCFLVPGGLPHAIGEGIFMIEMMEPTDLAIRLEFERGGYTLPIESRFMNKDIDLALSMINFKPFSKEDIKNELFIQPKLIQTYEDGSKEFSLIDETITDCFQLKTLQIEKKLENREDSFYVGVVVKGKGLAYDSQKNDLLYLKVGDRFLIPYKTDSIIFETSKELELILALPPE